MSDEYERKYLKVDDALFFERQVARHLLALPAFAGLSVVSGLAAAALGGGVVASGLVVGAVGGAAALLYLGLLAVFFGVARTVVSAEELRVEIGMLGPRIPLSRIVKAEVAPDARRGRGYFDPAYVPPTSTELVRVTYKDARDAERVVVIGTQRAAALVEAIQRGKGGAALPRVRVEAPVDPDVAAAEAEVEAELAREDAAHAKRDARRDSE